MALYSFCVKKKGASNYTRANMRHELPFLDFLAMQFSSKQELLKFLGVDPEKFEDIAIVYQNNRTEKILPLYFDAPELETISREMIDLSSLDECDTLIEALALGYTFPDLAKVATEVPTLRQVDDIISKIAYDNRPRVAFRKNRMNQKAVEYYENGRYEMFRNELMRSYLGIRKAYMSLRETNHIVGKTKAKVAPTLTMQELVKRHSEAKNKTFEILRAYEILKSLTLTSYEESLVVRILADDENAYEELMASDTERLEYLSPLIVYLNERRGKVRKIGTID